MRQPQIRALHRVRGKAIIQRRAAPQTSPRQARRRRQQMMMTPIQNLRNEGRLRMGGIECHPLTSRRSAFHSRISSDDILTRSRSQRATGTWTPHVASPMVNPADHLYGVSAGSQICDLRPRRLELSRGVSAVENQPRDHLELTGQISRL